MLDRAYRGCDWLVADLMLVPEATILLTSLAGFWALSSTCIIHPSTQH